MPKNMNLGDALKCWLDNLYEGKTNSAFGVVKTDKYPTLMHGNMAYTNYQLINTLGIGDAGLAELLKKSFEYLKRIQNDPMYLRYHISNNSFDNLDLDNLLLENYRKEVTLDMLNFGSLFLYIVLFLLFQDFSCCHKSYCCYNSCNCTFDKWHCSVKAARCISVCIKTNFLFHFEIG